ncbi:MAG: hypothetical protein M3Z02_04675 [Actinomycetota bacterium]|nr:hypothetical protein [Actinomycetota bacterium]
MGLQAPAATHPPVVLASVNLRQLASVPDPRRRWWLVLPLTCAVTAVGLFGYQRHAAPAAAASRAERSAAGVVSSFLDATGRHDQPAVDALLCREFRNNPPAVGEVAVVPNTPVRGHELVAAHVYTGASGGARANSSAWVKERLTLADGTASVRTYQLVVDDASWRVCGLR